MRVEDAQLSPQGVRLVLEVDLYCLLPVKSLLTALNIIFQLGVFLENTQFICNFGVLFEITLYQGYI